MNPTINPDEIRLRLPDVERLTGLKRSTIYRKIAAGEFPKQICLGRRCSVWIAGEVRAWNEAQRQRWPGPIETRHIQN